MKTWSRKDFLKTSLIGSGAALVAGSSRLYGQVAPAAGSAAGDIRVAVVGINAQGAGHMRDYINKLPGARRQMLLQAYSPGCTTRAMAELLGQSEDSLYQMLRRLRLVVR
jgi:DNA-directed RNA polymerase specialized sigma24 family protein